jgi:hypothetical protein
MSTEMLAGWPVRATRNYLDNFRDCAARSVEEHSCSISYLREFFKQMISSQGSRCVAPAYLAASSVLCGFPLDRECNEVPLIVV